MTQHCPNRLLAGLFLLVATASCASLEHVPITSSNEGQNKGIRYYETSPYLIVHSNPNGTLNIRLEHLPDPNRKMAVQPKATGAKIETTLEFNHGSLKSADSLADATVVPKAIINAAKSVLPSILDQMEAGRKKEVKPLTDYPVPPPFIFKIVVLQDKTLLIGGQANGEPIRVTLTNDSGEKTK